MSRAAATKPERCSTKSVKCSSRLWVAKKSKSRIGTGIRLRIMQRLKTGAAKDNLPENLKPRRAKVAMAKITVRVRTIEKPLSHRATQSSFTKSKAEINRLQQMKPLLSR